MIINLTQHAATKEQVETGVFEPRNKGRVQLDLTFDSLPNKAEVMSRASVLAEVAKQEILVKIKEKEYSSYSLILDAIRLADAGLVQPLFSLIHPRAMIGGAPYLMAPLEAELKKLGIEPVYAFSERVSEETVQADGTVVKTNVFKHVGFVSTW